MNRKEKKPSQNFLQRMSKLSLNEESNQKTSSKITGKDNAQNRLESANYSVPSTSAQRFDDKKGDTSAEEWLEDHPWEDKLPNRNESMATTIGTSDVYTLTAKWHVSDEEAKPVDMERIYHDLPNFIEEMRGPSSREDLQYLLSLQRRHEALTVDSSHPHILEIDQEVKEVKPKDKPSPVKKGQKLKAFSSNHSEEPVKENYYHLDCEYMLKIYLPDSFKFWFNIEDGRRIRSVETNAENRRWIFIPSFRRAEIALMDWPKDDTITPTSTIRILVVRPFQFDKYVRNHGHTFPVISLPQDEIGAGYPRFWIQKIALHLKLHFIWMIDDSVECFYEYHPSKKPERNYSEARRRPFGQVFKRIEELVKNAQQEENPVPIAAMSPKRFMGATPLKKAFVCSSPRIAVFLNLTLLEKKKVYYRPEL